MHLLLTILNFCLSPGNAGQMITVLSDQVHYYLVPVVGLRVEVGSSKVCCQHWVCTHPTAKPDFAAARDAGLCAAVQACSRTVISVVMECLGHLRSIHKNDS